MLVRSTPSVGPRLMSSLRAPLARRAVSTASRTTRPWRIAARVGLAAAVAAACHAPTRPDSALVLTTDRPAYAAAPLAGGPTQYTFTVVARLRNTSEAPVYFEACGTAPLLVYAVELIGGEDPDGSAFSPGWSCPAGPPLVVAPGAERVDTLALRGPTAFLHGIPGVSAPQPLGAVRGRMRLVYGGRTCAGRGACPPDAAGRPVTIRSTEFTVAPAS